MTPIVLALLAVAQPECEGAVSQPQLNACASADLVRADAALNAQWLATLRRIREEASSAQAAELRVAALRSAQRVWISFRDLHCQSAHPAGIGASLDYTLGIYCRVDLTKQRTKQLAEIAREP